MKKRQKRKFKKKIEEKKEKYSVLEFSEFETGKDVICFHHPETGQWVEMYKDDYEKDITLKEKVIKKLLT